MLIKIIEYFKEKKQHWEDTCKRCGICCYRKEKRNGQFFIDFNSPCEFLDTKLKICKIYNERFQVCADCRKVTIFHAKFSRLLPDTCGYVEKYRFREKKKK